MLVAVTEHVDGVWRVRIDWEQSEPDQSRFGVLMYVVSERYYAQALASGLVPAGRESPVTLSTMYALPSWRASVLRSLDALDPLKWRVLRWLWRAGLIEAPPEPVDGPARFAPFPWRGARRRYK